ncbi:MAG: MerR family transcriptional regulator [Agathobacter sp.]|nr:MerR family transcriptional regulator [Agathobacter sp.]
MKEQLYDINTVCEMLGVTSRTLRFWEEKGLIGSQKTMSGRRQYTQEQVETIKRVITLRALGLSVKKIQELQNNELDLRAAINEHRAAVYAAIEKKQREINVLSEALALIDNGGILYGTEIPVNAAVESNYEEIAARCAAAVVYNDEELLYSYFSEKMKAYLPPDVYRRVRRDFLEPLGGFVEFGERVADKNYKNIVYQYVKYEKLGMRIQFVFHDEEIYGLWLTYYEI